MNQPTLFEPKAESEKIEEILLYALGEFQSRGFALAERELPLDRLLGAFKRAVEHYKVSDLTDEQIAETLEKIGAKVKRLPGFVAKHPFRVTVSNSLAESSLEFYNISQKND